MTSTQAFVRALAYPANLVCDNLHISDENERSVVRMLVNALIWTTLGVVVVVLWSV
ncbi:MAG TPA: hypothetical protein VHX19_10870 [Stellaceae bacterium]|jgi:hypothetical protein|nr:hypothetical protein [Stellaceae bacterium]